MTDAKYYTSHREKILAVNKLWNIKNKDKLLGYLKKSKAKHQKKHKARMKVYYAIKIGKLIRQNCEVCAKKESFAHHDDYNKPLDVRWLCRQHHEDYHHRILAKK